MDYLDVDKIKAPRNQLGLTQAHASRLAGFKVTSMWGGVEKKRRPNVTIETLDRIARVLHVHPGAAQVMPLDVDKLRTLRRESGHTQVSAASAAGLSVRQHLTAIENGTVRNLKLSTLYRIAEVLGVHPRELLKPLPKPKRPSRSRSAMKAKDLLK